MGWQTSCLVTHAIYYTVLSENDCFLKFRTVFLKGKLCQKETKNTSCHFKVTLIVNLHGKVVTRIPRNHFVGHL